MPRPSDMKPSTGRRRHFGGGRRGRKNKLSSEDHGRNGSGFVSHGFSRSLGAVAWLWHTATRVVGWSRIDEGGGGAEDWSGNGRVDGSSSAASGILLAFGAVATAATIMIFRFGSESACARGRDALLFIDPRVKACVCISALHTRFSLSRPLQVCLLETYRTVPHAHRNIFLFTRLFMLKDTSRDKVALLQPATA